MKNQDIQYWFPWPVTPSQLGAKGFSQTSFSKGRVSDSFFFPNSVLLNDDFKMVILFFQYLKMLSKFQNLSINTQREITYSHIPVVILLIV